MTTAPYSIALSLIVPWAISVPAAAQETHPLTEGVTVEVLELRHITPSIINLTYAITNETSDAVHPGAIGMASGGYMNTAMLLDLKNLTHHRVGASNAGCLCSMDTPVPPGGRMEFWAHYAAPPADVTAMTVQFPLGAPFYNVPITE